MPRPPRRNLGLLEPARPLAALLSGVKSPAFVQRSQGDQEAVPEAEPADMKLTTQTLDHCATILESLDTPTNNPLAVGNPQEAKEMQVRIVQTRALTETLGRVADKLMTASKLQEERETLSETRSKFSKVLEEASPLVCKMAVSTMVSELEASPAALGLVRETLEAIAQHLLPLASAVSANSPAFVKVLDESDPKTLKLIMIQVLSTMDLDHCATILEALEKAADKLLAAGKLPEERAALFETRSKFSKALDEASPRACKMTVQNMVSELEGSPAAFDLVREMLEAIAPMASAAPANRPAFAKVLDEADPKAVKLTMGQVLNSMDMDRYATILEPLEKAADKLLAAGRLRAERQALAESRSKFSKVLEEASPHACKKAVQNMILELEASPATFDLVREILEGVACPLLPMTSSVSVSNPAFAKVLDEADPAAVKVTIMRVLGNMEIDHYARILEPLEKAADKLLAAGKLGEEREALAETRSKFSKALEGSSPSACKMAVQNMVSELEACPAAFDLVREILEAIARPLLPMSFVVPENRHTFAKVLESADPKAVKVTILQVLNDMDMDHYATILEPLEKAANKLLAAGTR